MMILLKESCQRDYCPLDEVLFVKVGKNRAPIVDRFPNDLPYYRSFFPLHINKIIGGAPGSSSGSGYDSSQH